MPGIIIALDLPTAEAALRFVDHVGAAADFYKVGAPLFTASGPAVIAALRDRGKRVFLDLKYHDIPHTVARAVEAAAQLGVELLTLHTAGGSAMLRAAREAVPVDGPRLLGVTVLTSLGASDLSAIWGREVGAVRDEVFRLADLAAAAGLHGVVASPREAADLRRRHGPDFLVVTPGIRLAGDDRQDQVRTATPAAAASAGADYLVMGRSVLRAPDPVGVIQQVRDELTRLAGVAP